MIGKQLIETLAIFRLAIINIRVSGRAQGVEVVPQETAIIECAINDTAACKKSSSKRAVLKLTVDQNGIVEKPPIPFDISERARNKYSVEITALQ